MSASFPRIVFNSSTLDARKTVTFLRAQGQKPLTASQMIKHHGYRMDDLETLLIHHMARNPHIPPPATILKGCLLAQVGAEVQKTLYKVPESMIKGIPKPKVKLPICHIDTRFGLKHPCSLERIAEAVKDGYRVKTDEEGILSGRRIKELLATPKEEQQRQLDLMKDSLRIYPYLQKYYPLQ